MLTGDAAKVADKVAAELGIDMVYSELLPADKVKMSGKAFKGKTGKIGIGICGRRNQ